jgi:glutathione S-transferase
LDKPKLLVKNPAANLPYLVDGDKIIAETASIIVYLAHRTGRTCLLGRNTEEQVIVAAVASIYDDYFRDYLKLVYGGYTEGSWEEALKVYSGKFEGYWKKLSEILGKKEFIAGEITWVDFALGEALQILNQLAPQVV